MWQNVVKPVLPDNHNKFLKELSLDDILIFEQVAGKTLEALGYTRQFPDTKNHVFTDVEISAFEAINQKLKQEVRLKLKPEDLEKRRRQEQLLLSIRERIR